MATKRDRLSHDELCAIALRALDESEQAKKDMAYQAENWQAAEEENERLRAFGRAWKTLAKQLKIEQERLRNALELSYVRIGDPPDGEPLQYLGCYITRWQRQWTDIVGEENVSGFRRYDPELEAAAQAVEGRDDGS